MKKEIMYKAMLYWICVVIISILYISLIQRFNYIKNPNIFLYLSIIKTALLICTLYLIRKNHINGFCVVKRRGIGLIICLITLCVYFINQTVAAYHISFFSFRHISYLLGCFTTGFFEEFFFRLLLFGLVVKYFANNTRNNLIKSIIITSFLFSAAHITNFFNENYDPLGVVNQMVFAFFIGVFFQSLYLRFKNIYLLGILHGLINYFGTFKVKLLQIAEASSTDVLSDILLSLLLILSFGLIIILPASYFIIGKKFKSDSF